MTETYVRPVEIYRRRVRYGRATSLDRHEVSPAFMAPRMDRSRLATEERQAVDGPTFAINRPAGAKPSPSYCAHGRQNRRQLRMDKRIEFGKPQPSAGRRCHKCGSSKRQLVVMTAICLLVFCAATTFAVSKFFLTKMQDEQKLERARQTNSPEDIQAAEGTDETDIATSDIDNYKVAADHPRVISIDSIGLKAKVLPMGLNPDNSIQAPTNIHDTGWFTTSTKPGQAGVTLIDGHDVGATKAGIFAKLGQLKKGSKIVIELGNGQKLNYSVTGSEIIELGQIDMNSILDRSTAGQSVLVLMTCHGQATKDNGKVTQTHRLIVYASPDK